MQWLELFATAAVVELVVGRAAEHDATLRPCLILKSLREVHGVADQRVLEALFRSENRRGNGADPLGAVYELFPILAEFRRRHAGALSGGQQQQLAIGRALVAAPDVLLLDEASLGRAPRMVDAVFAALIEIRDRGVTILLVEQRAQRTVALADRTHVLANGELRTTLTPADADDTEKLIEAYLS